MTKPMDMTPAQHAILRAADPHTRVIPGHLVDHRTMPSLARNGWAQRVLDRRRGKKVFYRWEITAAGISARDDAEIRTPPPRPNWRGREVTRISRNEYVVDGHTLFRPELPMLWRVVCPAGSEPVGYGDRLADATERLAEHLLTRSGHGTPRDPATPLPTPLEPIDLDQHPIPAPQ